MATLGVTENADGALILTILLSSATLESGLFGGGRYRKGIINFACFGDWCVLYQFLIIPVDNGQSACKTCSCNSRL